MKTFTITRNSNDVPVRSSRLPQACCGGKRGNAGGNPTDLYPCLHARHRMRDLHDTIIHTVLQHTRGNRLRAAQLFTSIPGQSVVVWARRKVSPP